MKKERDYIQDIAEIRSMMERSSKFLSLSGWAGIMAGIYALAGAFVAWRFLHFSPDGVYDAAHSASDQLNVVLLAAVVLVLALGTAVFDSLKKAKKRGEKAWNYTSKRLVNSMLIPLGSGGLLVLILISKGLIGLVAPLTLLFYGLSLYNAGRFTYNEVKVLGLVEIILGLICAWYVEYGLVFWAAGFGLAHIIYGIYMFYRYEQ